MKIQKMLMGAVAGLIFGTGFSHAGCLEPVWLSKHRWNKDGIKMVNEDYLVDYGGVRFGGIYHGRFSSSLGNFTHGLRVLKKIVIEQKIPCYVVPIHWNEHVNTQNKSMWFKNDIEDVKREGNKIVLYKGLVHSGFEQTTYISDKMRIHKRSRATPSTAKLIAGDGFSCLDKPNSETWTVYWKLDGKWVAVAKENMGKFQGISKPPYMWGTKVNK